MEDVHKQAQKVTCKIRDVVVPHRTKKDAPFADAQALLTTVQERLSVVRSVVGDALEKNTFDEKRLSDALENLHLAGEKLPVLEKLDVVSREKLQPLSHGITTIYQGLVEEAGVLDLWVQGYDAYVDDLKDNFKNLPNTALLKPAFDALYDELGISLQASKQISFATVQEQYKKRFDALKAKYGDEFEFLCFRPYLRVLQYVFRTPYSKKQYDTFLMGKDLYNAKGKTLKAHVPTIQKLFGQDLAQLSIIKATLQAEIC